MYPAGCELKTKEKEILRPIRLSSDEVASFRISIAGHVFIAPERLLLCPECGVIQQLFLNKDIDGALTYYLRFMCEHYKKPEVVNPQQNPHQ